MNNIKVIWWDVRNLKERLETVYLDPEKGQARPEAALPATVLEFDHSIPTKFMAGTESGNRNGNNLYRTRLHTF